MAGTKSANLLLQTTPGKEDEKNWLELLNALKRKYFRKLMLLSMQAEFEPINVSDLILRGHTNQTFYTFYEEKILMGSCWIKKRLP
jgi:hypothetical protein